ncbi:MAG: threonylcarbamoyl-AMP synthase [Bacteroidetes bacterium]|nr:threonylcarbamoyl-AMP synthase [Bacteroidota bacterium]
MLLQIYPENPNPKYIQTIIECLNDGGIVIFPTDTVYGMGCDIFKHKAVEKIASIKGIKLEKANFSFICYDLSHISDYTKQISNNAYKLMKKALPGPFTFILESNNNVPKLFQSKKKTVGIRIPDNEIIRLIVKELGHPIMSTSVHDEDEVIEYTTDPELIHEKYADLVDIVVDGGYGDNEASTVVDCTNDEFEIIRQGKGILEDYL